MVMKNPIFSIDTLFLDQGADGDIRYLTGEKTTMISGGTRIIRLSERQSLVDLNLKSGNTLVMSAETAFALAKDGAGKLIRYSPIQKPPLKQHFLDWQSPVDDDLHRQYFLAGAMAAHGTHKPARSRESSIDLLPAQVPAIVHYLQNVGDDMRAKSAIHGHSNHVTLIEFKGRIMIRSRMLTLLVGSLLSTKTQVPSFDPHDLDLSVCWSFMKGLLSTADRDGDALVIRHRHADTIKTLARCLWYRFGVAADMHVNPYEPELTPWSSTPKGPYLRLSAEQRASAFAAGLDDTSPFQIPNLSGRDEIESISARKFKSHSAIVVPGEGREFPLTANSYVFEPKFHVPVEIEVIASHPALLGDSSDPSAF